MPAALWNVVDQVGLGGSTDQVEDLQGLFWLLAGPREVSVAAPFAQLLFERSSGRWFRALGEEGWRICPASLVARVPGKLTLTI